MSSVAGSGKIAISQALRILRESISDLWPLLRDDWPFYLRATIVLFALDYVIAELTSSVSIDQTPVAHLMGGAGGLAYSLLLLSWSAVTAIRSAERFSSLSMSHFRALVQYCLVGIIVITYGIIALVVVFLVAFLSVLAVAFLIDLVAWVTRMNPSGSPIFVSWFVQLSSAPQLRYLTVTILLPVALAVFYAKLGAAGAIRILNDRPHPIKQSWALTRRFWPQSFALAVALTILNSLLSWISPSPLSFTPTSELLDLPCTLLLLTFGSRVYVQFAHEMLNASEASPVEAPAL